MKLSSAVLMLVAGAAFFACKDRAVTASQSLESTAYAQGSSLVQSLTADLQAGSVEYTQTSFNGAKIERLMSVPGEVSRDALNTEMQKAGIEALSKNAAEALRQADGEVAAFSYALADGSMAIVVYGLINYDNATAKRWIEAFQVRDAAGATLDQLVLSAQVMPTIDANPKSRLQKND